MTKTKTKNIGWIIRNKENGQFINKNPKYTYTKKMQNALIIPTRELARICKTEDETVYKVAVNENGSVKNLLVGDFGSRQSSRIGF